MNSLKQKYLAVMASLSILMFSNPALAAGENFWTRITGGASTEGANVINLISTVGLVGGVGIIGYQLYRIYLRSSNEQEKQRHSWGSIGFAALAGAGLMVLTSIAGDLAGTVDSDGSSKVVVKKVNTL